MLAGAARLSVSMIPYPGLIQVEDAQCMVWHSQRADPRPPAVVRASGATDTILVSAADSGGLIERVFPPDEGVPLLVHRREDEALYVVCGIKLTERILCSIHVERRITVILTRGSVGVIEARPA
jgi:hypothetical protein